MTEPGWVVLPLTWAVVLTLSAAAKLRAVGTTQEALRALPLPMWLQSRRAVIGLPLAELALVLAVLVSRGAGFVTASVVLLAVALAYLAVVAVVLRRGEATSCACFGALSGGEVTGSTLARNVVLLVGAALTLAWAAAGQSVGATLLRLDVGGWIWVAATAWVAALAALLGLRHVVEGSYLRTPIPDAALVGPDGRVSLRQLASTQARLLVFLSPNCGPCIEIAGHLPQWTQQLWPLSVHAVVSNPALAPEFTYLEPILLWADESDSAARAFGITGTPAAVVLGSDGLVAGGPVTGSTEVADLVTTMTNQVQA
ncbi:MAG: MauE/DoxX family redox-associated membrane protein [Tetrasphaera sp.]